MFWHINRQGTEKTWYGYFSVNLKKCLKKDYSVSFYYTYILHIHAHSFGFVFISIILPYCFDEVLWNLTAFSQSLRLLHCDFFDLEELFLLFKNVLFTQEQVWHDEHEPNPLPNLWPFLVTRLTWVLVLGWWFQFPEIPHLGNWLFEVLICSLLVNKTPNQY